MNELDGFGEKDHIGVMFMRFSDGKSYVGSGYLLEVDSDGKTGWVLTCAHNLVIEEQGMANKELKQYICDAAVFILRYPEKADTN